MLILNRGTIHQIMIKIFTYNEINPTAWQELVDSSPYATWFQTPEAYAFYASNPDEMTPFAYGVVEDFQPTPNPFLKEGESCIVAHRRISALTAG